MGKRDSIGDTLVAIIVIVLFCMWVYSLTHKKTDENSQGCTVYYSLDGKESTTMCGIGQ